MTGPISSLDILAEFWDGLATSFDRYPVIRTGERDPIPTDVRRRVYARDHFRCQWCARTWNLQLDHIVPWSAGGSDDESNLRTLCAPCNTDRSNYVRDAHLVEIRPNAFLRERELARAAEQPDPGDDE